MKVTFLGTGTSQGVPMIGCDCEVCQSQDTRDNRLRTSIWIQNEDTSIVIDSGPDFRYQMLRAQVKHIDGVVFTHGHKDHVAGLDDIRAYNYWQNEDIKVYANAQTEEVLKREFAYVFSEFKYPGVPSLDLHPLYGQDIAIGSMTLETIKVLHYKLEVYGYRIGDFTYITDANYIDEENMKKLIGTKVLVLNALRHEKHISHFTLSEALEIIEQIKPQKAYLTHISHQLGTHEKVTDTLPDNVYLAYDTLSIEI